MDGVSARYRCEGHRATQPRPARERLAECGLHGTDREGGHGGEEGVGQGGRDGEKEKMEKGRRGGEGWTWRRRWSERKVKEIYTQ